MPFIQLQVRFYNLHFTLLALGFPGGASDKEPACQCQRYKRCGFDSSIGKVPWRRTWQPTPVFLFGESHGQRSLVGYSLQGCKESNAIEATQHTLLALSYICPSSHPIFFYHYLNFKCISQQIEDISMSLTHYFSMHIIN